MRSNRKVSASRIKVLIPSLWLLGLLSIAVSARGQANVAENQEQAVLYVDGLHGSDSNPGTQVEPLKTIGKAAALAVTNNHHGVGTRVTILPGTYRENIQLPHDSRDSGSPITFEAATPGTAVVSGADVWTGWQNSSQNPDVYMHPWPYQWGRCPTTADGPLQQDIILRREMVFVDAEPLTQVLSLKQMAEGSFFADEGGGLLSIWPAAGTNVAAATIEVAVRPSLFLLEGKKNIVLRGLTFQYANSCSQGAAVDVSLGSNNILIDGDSFDWNNAVGLDFNRAQNVTVRASVARHNGQIGLGGSFIKNGLWESDEGSYNNWRGAQGAYYGWRTAGGKFLEIHNTTFHNFEAFYNEATGLWLDTDNANVTVDSLVSSENLGTGFVLEASEGPTTLSNSLLCNSGSLPHPYFGTAGVVLHNSSSVTLNGNTVLNNGHHEIQVLGMADGRAVTNWETGQQYVLFTENVTLLQNTIGATGAEQVFRNPMGDVDWTHFQSTLTSDHNVWWNPDASVAFSVPARQPLAMDFRGWQSLTGQDAHSTFAPPAGNRAAGCAIQPDGPDYWFLVDRGTGATSPGGQTSFVVAVVPRGGFTGRLNLSLDGVQQIAGASAQFQTGALDVPVDTVSSSTLTVSTGQSTKTGSYPLTIVANSGRLTRTIAVSLMVQQSSVRLSTSALNLGSEPLHSVSAPQTVTMTNAGKVPLSINSVAMASRSDFAQTNTCGTSLAAGATCTISVTFRPGARGARLGSLTITDADPTGPQIVTLAGTGT
jgi:hypothetical protein